MKHFILLFILFMLSGFSFSQMITRDMLGPNQETALKALYRSLNIAENTGICQFHWDTIQGTYYNNSTTFQNKITLDENGMIKGLNFSACSLYGYIPDEIGLLSELNVLHLYYTNCIYSLSDSICTTTLNNFSLGSQEKCFQESHLPTCFDELYFQYFIIFHENIYSFPNISYDNNLKSLTVYSTKIDKIPENYAGIPSGNTYNFGANEISEIPVFSEASVALFNNRLQFNDIEKNMSNFPSANYYSPQKEVRVSSPQYFCGAEMRLFVEVGGSANRYRWLKDGVEVQAFSEEAAYVKTNPTQDDAGTYVVEITNELVPGLTLQSEPIEVIIGNPPPPLIRHNE